MYTIGQFSRITRVSTKTLRWYDEIGLFKPAKVDDVTQYRYYEAGQVGTFQLILFLRNLGMGLEDIRSVLARGAGPEAFVSILEGQAAAVKAQMEAASATLSRIEQTLSELRRDGKMETSQVQVTIKEQPEIHAVAARRRIAINDGAFGQLIAEAAGKLRGAPAGPPLARYFDEEYDPENSDVEVLFPVPSGGHVTLPATKVASYLYVGPYQGVGQAYQNLLGWLNDHLESHGYKISGPIREVYLVGPDTGRPPAEFVTEIQVPVE